MFGKRQTADVVPFDPSTETGSFEAVDSDQAGKLSEAMEVTSQTGSEKGSSDEHKAADQQIPIPELIKRAISEMQLKFQPSEIRAMSRRETAEVVGTILDNIGDLSELDRRNAITDVVNALVTGDGKGKPDNSSADNGEGSGYSPSKSSVEAAKAVVQPILLQRIDAGKAMDVPRAQLAAEITEVIAEILGEEKIQLNLLEQRDLVTTLMHDMLGLGPLEVLLSDEKVTDIMVNGPKQIYVERGGKLELTDVEFRDNGHVMQIAQRIVSAVGRRVDESTPLVDARLADGSRVNIIAPPLAIDGASISIRKFSKKKITLDTMEKQRNISPEMATVLKIAARSQLNILVSGGTGSGKTTLLNALSRMIDEGERIVTIEDAAELQLQQPHVVRLETRPPNLEGEGEITQRDLVKNALRMRPDRIILGEIRAGEALDMLQAMNTGHDGSLGTIHANRPREALTRLENMVAMAGVKLPNEAVRSQIAGAVNLIVQISRMRDGMRRITHVTEVVGMEGEVITTQDLFTYQFEGEDPDGNLLGQFVSSGLRPNFTSRAQYFGLDKALLAAMG